MVRAAAAAATGAGRAVSVLPGLVAAVLVVWAVYLLAGTPWAMVAAAVVLLLIDWRLR